MMNTGQKKDLAAPLHSSAVKTRKQAGRELSYVEGWHAIKEANRIFDFDGWNRETVYLKEVCRYETESQRGGKNWKVGMEAKVRVTVDGVTREGTGYGSGTMGDLYDAMESAGKEAETDAMKRALMTFGNPFGLALYDKTQAEVDDTPPTLPKARAREPYAKLRDQLVKACERGMDDIWSWWEAEKQNVAMLPTDWRDMIISEAIIAGLNIGATDGELRSWWTSWWPTTQTLGDEKRGEVERAKDVAKSRLAPAEAAE